jgi:hypothetical protein
MLGIELVAAGVGALVTTAISRRRSKRAALRQIERRTLGAEREIEEIGRRTREAMLTEAWRRSAEKRPGS